MSKVIKISSALYDRLGRHSKGFDDTAEIVISRMADHYEGVESSDTTQPGKCGNTTFGAKDSTKYRFNGHIYGKKRLVLAIVQQYGADNPDTTYEDLLGVFPKDLQGPIGVVNPLDFVKDKYQGKPNPRHHMKANEIIHLSDGDVVTCTEWGISNIDNFIEVAQTLGYEVTS